MAQKLYVTYNDVSLLSVVDARHRGWRTTRPCHMGRPALYNTAPWHGEFRYLSGDTHETPSR